MTSQPSGPGRTRDQIIYLYERQLNFAVLWVLVWGFATVAVGLALLYAFDMRWPGWVLGLLSILVGGMLQRIMVLRVKCPACGARVLGRIHSIFQAGNVRSCPFCDVNLRS